MKSFKRTMGFGIAVSALVLAALGPLRESRADSARFCMKYSFDFSKSPELLGNPNKVLTYTSSTEITSFGSDAEAIREARKKIGTDFDQPVSTQICLENDGKGHVMSRCSVLATHVAINGVLVQKNCLDPGGKPPSLSCAVGHATGRACPQESPPKPEGVPPPRPATAGAGVAAP